MKLGSDYKVFGRSFDGLDLRFLLPIKKHYPRDYQRILELIPLADLEIFEVGVRKWQNTDDRKQQIADAKAAAKAKANQWKRKQKPAVKMPELTGDPETDSRADLDAVKQGFRDRLKAETSARWMRQTANIGLHVFQSRAQSEAFLREIGWRKFGDKYLDGVKVAKMMGIELPDDEVPYVAEPKIDKAWAGLVADEDK